MEASVTSLRQRIEFEPTIFRSIHQMDLEPIALLETHTILPTILAMIIKEYH